MSALALDTPDARRRLLGQQAQMGGTFPGYSCRSASVLGQACQAAVHACRACRRLRSASATPSVGRCRTAGLCCLRTDAVCSYTMPLQHHRAAQFACCMHASFQTVCCRLFKGMRAV